jgi:copper chaperone CopZ
VTDRIDLGLTGSGTGTGCSCCATSTTTHVTDAAPATVTDTILVSGMTCAHCVSSVTEELSAVAGVENVAVDLTAGGTSRVTIHSSHPIDETAVKAAVAQAGYAVVGTA